MGSKLYVGNLSYTTSEETLRAAFEEGGRQVQNVSIILDRDTGRSRGFGFVQMASDEDARAAMDALDGFELDGRALRVKEARERDGVSRRSEGRGAPPPRGSSRERPARGPDELRGDAEPRERRGVASGEPRERRGVASGEREALPRGVASGEREALGAWDAIEGRGKSSRGRGRGNPRDRRDGEPERDRDADSDRPRGRGRGRDRDWRRDWDL